MGYIKLYNVLFENSASENQTVRVEYRLASSLGAYTLASNAAPVLANGNFNPVFVINSLVDGETYTIKTTNLCNGSVNTQNITVGGGNCTGFTVQANVGGARVEYEECGEGSGGARVQLFINGGDQETFCCFGGVYSVTLGAVTEISSNGACQ